MIKDLKEELKKEELILQAKSMGLIIEDYKLYASEDRKREKLTTLIIILMFIVGIMIGALAVFAEFYSAIMFKFFGG